MKNLCGRKKASRILFFMRYEVLRRRFNLQIDRPAYVSSSARFDFDSDGFGLRGSLYIQKGARISVGAYLAPYGGRIEIGENAFIGPYATLYGHGGLTIGNDVLIAGHVVIVPAQHRFSSIDLPIREQGEDAAGIKIGDDVWIGTGARVLDGITIGRGVVIAAGAVVTSSLPDYSIAAGVPARVIRSRQAGSEFARASIDP